MQPIQCGNQYYTKFCNDRTSMCSIPKCYGASKPASKQDELVKLPSQQSFKKSRADVVKSNLPCQTVEQKSLPTLPHITDLQSMVKF